MLSNSEIHKRLLGGTGTTEGAIKGWVTRRKGTKRKKKKTEKCIKTDNVKIYSKNVEFDIPNRKIDNDSNADLMDEARNFLVNDLIEKKIQYKSENPPTIASQMIPTAPPMTPQSASPLVKSIDTKVNRMSIKGEGLYGGSDLNNYFDPKEYRHAHLANNFNILMNERNKYGFGY